jgi:hypothetical protein
MATPPDFTAGQILTAAQMNSIGLWKIASGSLSVTTSATNVTGVFSSDHKNYKLLLKVISRTANPSRFSLRYIVGTTPTTVNYYQSGVGADPALDAVVYYQRTNNDNQLFFDDTGFSAIYSFDIFSPNLAQPTSHSGHVLVGQQPYPYMVGGFNSPATQHTGFQLFSNSGTLSMEYQVFGYRD